MGAAVWLYMWCIDKVTKIDDEGWGWVLGGRPIKYKEIVFLTRRSVLRYAATLKKEGYIISTRTPYGVIIKVAKAKKQFGREVPKTVHLKKERSAKNGTREVPKTVHSGTKSGTSNKTVHLQGNRHSETKVSQIIHQKKKDMKWRSHNENEHSDQFEKKINADTGEPPVVEKKGKPAQVFEIFKEVLGLAPLNWKVNKTQWTAAGNLLEEHGLDSVRNALNFYKANKDEKYCPTVVSPNDLDTKWSKLSKFKKNNKL